MAQCTICNHSPMQLVLQRISIFFSLSLALHLRESLASVSPMEPCRQVVTITLQTQTSIISSINKWRWDEWGLWERQDGWRAATSCLFSCSFSGLHYLDQRAHTPCGAHTNTHTHRDIAIDRKINTHPCTSTDTDLYIQWHSMANNQFAPLRPSWSFGVHHLIFIFTVYWFKKEQERERNNTFPERLWIRIILFAKCTIYTGILCGDTVRN